MFDPFQHLAAAKLLTQTTSWYTPVEPAATNPLPPSSSTHGPALRSAIHLAKLAPKATLTTSTAATAKSPRFYLLALVDPSHETGPIMCRYATWGSYRPEEDAEVSHSASGATFLPDCKIAPSVISLDCAQAAFQRWLKDQAKEIHAKSKPGPPFHISPEFWSSNTVQALLSLSFCSSGGIDSPDDLQAGRIMPMSFLLSIVEATPDGYPRVPSHGLPLSKLCQLLLNIIFMLHLPGRDSELYPWLGPL